MHVHLNMTIIFKHIFSETSFHIKVKIYVESPWEKGTWEHEFIKMDSVTSRPSCPYMAKTITIFFFGTRSSLILKLGKDHQRLKVYKVYINDDPGYFSTVRHIICFD